MRTLLIVRHAKSSWNNQFLSDYERPLNNRGRNDAPRMGRWIKQHELTPALIICSSAERALRTAELMGYEAGYQAEILATRRLYLAAPAAYVALVVEKGKEVPAGPIMVVGHNPGIEDLVSELTGVETSVTTANVIVVDFDMASWDELAHAPQGKLRHFWRPRELPDTLA